MAQKLTRNDFIKTGALTLGATMISPFGFGESVCWPAWNRLRMNTGSRRVSERGDATVGVLELRNYLLKPGSANRFTRYFKEHFVDPQIALGASLPGQFHIKDQADRFFWMRGFENMTQRLAFLRAFYDSSEAWITFGHGANEMMLDSDHVHLLKPLPGADTVSARSWPGEKNTAVRIDYLFLHGQDAAHTGAFYRTAYDRLLKPKGLPDATFWVCEMAASEFRHPVIQQKDLLVIITPFTTEHNLGAASALMDDYLADTGIKAGNGLYKKERIILLRQ